MTLKPQPSGLGSKDRDKSVWLVRKDILPDHGHFRGAHPVELHPLMLGTPARHGLFIGPACLFKAPVPDLVRVFDIDLLRVAQQAFDQFRRFAEITVICLVRKGQPGIGAELIAELHHQLDRDPAPKHRCNQEVTGALPKCERVSGSFASTP